jgi:hypothetical protein
MPEWILNFDHADLLAELRDELKPPSSGMDNYFSGHSFNPDRIELLVARTISPSLKIEIFANEHPPPHFRVKYAGETANYRIRDCEQLNGGLRRHYRVIRDWHSKNKPALIDAWNNFRPSDCPVGHYVET